MSSKRLHGPPCGRCGRDNPEGNVFCGHCGARLVLRCTRCGADNGATAQLCGACGARLEAVEPRPSAVRRVPRERKQVTVLFADLVESTSMIADLDPEDAVERLRPAVAGMIEAVRRADGTVVRAVGDGIMALFGVPYAQEAHAALACKAALAIREAVSRLAGAPAVRIGLHSGEVVSGALDESDAGPDAHGSTVHLASRIERIAAPGEICMTGECHRLVRAHYETEPLGPHSVRSFTRPVEIYRLVGPRIAPFDDHRAGADTPFRGREREFATLMEALRSSAAGNAQVIGIVAPPGVGKTRLCKEFSQWCRAQTIPVHEARALTYGNATPYQPVLEAFRAFFHISATTEAATARRSMARRLRALDRSFVEDLPLLEEFLGLADRHRPPLRLDPAARRARLLDIMRRKARIAGERRASVFIIEDLHWLDEASSEFVHALVEAVEGTRTLLVLNFRPSYVVPWAARPNYRQMALGELAAGDIHALVRDLVGDAPRLAELRGRIAERSGGNPFFAEELVRSLAESGMLAGEHRAYVPGELAKEEKLPATVQTVISERVDRLAEQDKTVLQIAAVLGKEFPLAVVQAVSSMSSEAIAAAVERLCEAELVEGRAGMDAQQYAFRHPLIQEVAYGMQLKARRTALHGALVGAIERFYAGRLDEFAALLAHHCEAAGRSLESASYLQRAALWLAKTNSAEALSLWKKIRALLDDQPHTEAINTMRVLANGQILGLGWREGMTAEEARIFAEEALTLSRQTGNRVSEMLVLGGYGRILAASGAADAYVELVKEALALATGRNRPGPDAAIYGQLSQAYGLAGLFHEALAANDTALTASVAEGNAEVRPGLTMNQIFGFDIGYWIRCLRARLLMQLGRFADADKEIDHLSRVADAQETTVRFIPHSIQVELAWSRGDASTAEEHAARVVALAKESGTPYMRTCAYGCLGLAKAAAGDFAGALREIGLGLDLARRARAGLEYEPRLVADLAETHYRAGDLSEAARAAQEAIDIARRRTARFIECRASIIRAVALGDAGDPSRRTEIGELLERARHLVTETGAAILEPSLARAQARFSPAVTSPMSSRNESAA